MVGALIFAPITHAADPGGSTCPGGPASTNGVTALLVGGQGSYAVLTPEQMCTAFGGYFAPYDDRISVPFPGDAEFNDSIPEGATNLYNAVLAQPAGAVLTIGGVSKGAPSVIEALRQLEAARENTTDGIDVPDADHMNVMIYGAPSRIYYSGVKYRPNLPVTPYDVYMVSAEYDGVADMPDNLFNILAVLNAAQGADMLHVDAAFNTDFANDPMHYKVETNADGGTVTTILIPYTDPIVPLLHPMLEAGADPVQLAKLSAILKPIIDRGYTRNNVFEKKKWIDGVVNIPLPAAATQTPGGTTVFTTAATVAKDQSEVTTAAPPAAPAPPAQQTEYVGKHRAVEPTDDDTAAKDTKKVARDFVKQLKDDFTKLTTKKDKSDSSSSSKADDKAEAKSEEKKETTAHETSSSTSSSSAGSSDTGSES
ncbi:PE-PPE domain protein [Mycolicibacterium chlorophenolicum]|uniref:PE-PPE domain protein n=1 Tax=Mycolicibacterium chlorophenolicum TaxID=37916 RepID=A0A0J6Y9N3_9MYCO|nr:PE-PPE domain protein [Mycolicibacterium chlorophenolicum]